MNKKRCCVCKQEKDLSEFRKAIDRVANFKFRYQEWAEKDDKDINVKALQDLINLAKRVVKMDLEREIVETQAEINNCSATVNDLATAINKLLMGE